MASRAHRGGSPHDHQNNGEEIARGHEPEALLFTTGSGGPWDRVAKLLRRLEHQGGIAKRVTPHVLRHTHATLALELGVRCITCRTRWGTRTRGPRGGMITRAADWKTHRRTRSVHYLGELKRCFSKMQPGGLR